MPSVEELRAAKHDGGIARLVSTWKLSLGGLRGWRRVVDGGDGEQYIGKVRGQPIAVIWSIAREADGQPWLHVSLSHAARIPTWDEVAEVKRLFVGADRYAAQVLPPEALYVNINPRVLHLWSPMEQWPLPEFSALTAEVGRSI